MPDLFSVEGKVALVTGASSGLGGHCARVLHAAGARVVGLSRSLGEFQAIADDDRAAFLSGDLSEAQDWTQLGEQIQSYFGSPDIIVNAAGVNLRKHADDTSVDDWATTMALNLTAPFLSLRPWFRR